MRKPTWHGLQSIERWLLLPSLSGQLSGVTLLPPVWSLPLSRVVSIRVCIQHARHITDPVCPDWYSTSKAPMKSEFPGQDKQCFLAWLWQGAYAMQGSSAMSSTHIQCQHELAGSRMSAGRSMCSCITEQLSTHSDIGRHSACWEM